MNDKIKQLKKKRNGFSLVELVVVMAIIGILLMVMAPNYQGFIQQAKGIGVKSDAKTLQTMISLVEVSATINETQTVNELYATLGASTEEVNLKDFIDNLKGDSIGLKAVTIASLDAIVSSGVIPPATP